MKGGKILRVWVEKSLLGLSKFFSSGVTDSPGPRVRGESREKKHSVGEPPSISPPGCLRQGHNGDNSLLGVGHHPAGTEGDGKQGNYLAAWPALPPRGRLRNYSRPGHLESSMRYQIRLLTASDRLEQPSPCQSCQPHAILINKGFWAKESVSISLQSPCTVILLQLVFTDLQELLIPP